VTDKRIWFITGAGRGMGVDIPADAQAAVQAPWSGSDASMCWSTWIRRLT
jgi:hypothetical protein